MSPVATSTAGALVNLLSMLMRVCVELDRAHRVRDSLACIFLLGADSRTYNRLTSGLLPEASPARAIMPSPHSTE